MNGTVDGALRALLDIRVGPAKDAARTVLRVWIDTAFKTFRTQVVANEGTFPLLGTMLLDGRRLIVDYGVKTTVLE